ncbi:MAG: antitoxin Xre/MbcA/ParS toxin-binding domain-containing protein [Nonlabens sp.]
MRTYDDNTGGTVSVEEAAAKYLSSFKGPMDKVRFIRNGISNQVFEQLRQEIPFSNEEWSKLLDVSLKSLQRYIKDESHIFKLTHSERILEVVEVCELGMEVFEDSDKFYGWTQDPKPALDYIAPIDLMRDSYGKELVLSELHAIAHGIFA